jgi:hypothetical protein
MFTNISKVSATSIFRIKEQQITVVTVTQTVGNVHSVLMDEIKLTLGQDIHRGKSHQQHENI